MQTSPREIAIVDFGDNDTQRLGAALRALGHGVQVVSRPAEVAEAPIAILSHPGSQAQVRGLLSDSGMAEALEARAHADLPTLALGSALFALCEGYNTGYESGPGLGLLPGIVRPLPSQTVRGAPLLSPHLGYNEVRPLKAVPLMAEAELFYFAHDHVIDVGQDWSDVLGETSHALLFPSLIARGQLIGALFQPEMSGLTGRRFLSSFAQLRRGAS